MSALPSVFGLISEPGVVGVPGIAVILGVWLAYLVPVACPFSQYIYIYEIDGLSIQSRYMDEINPVERTVSTNNK